MNLIPPLVALPLAAVVLLAAIYDIRFAKIPNWLNLTGVILGFALNTLVFAWTVNRPLEGALFALKGFALAFGLNLVFYILHFTGAGDVKLMGAVGALAGWKNWLGIFILNAILGGVLAVVMVLARGRLRKTFYNVCFVLSEMGHFRAPYLTAEELDVNSPKALRLPRGAVVALGTYAFFALSMLMVR